MVDKSILKEKESRLIIGSPGCGKTTRLLNIIDEELSAGTHHNRIAFVSFSVAAIEEAISRASSRFRIPRRDLRYFKTLHSLAFLIQGLKKENAFEWPQRKDFAKLNRLRLTYNSKEDSGFQTPDDKLMDLINLARVMRMSIKDTLKYARKTSEVELGKALRIDEAFENYKSSNNLFDYTDTILSVVEGEFVLPELDHLIVDEAQDLSKLQWDFVFKLAENAKKVTIAGDDKQAINIFAGADVDTFLHLDIPMEVLAQSYRIPTNVHKLANRIVKKIKGKYSVDWIPREGESGNVYKINMLPVRTIEKSDESWLILARNKAMLTETCENFIKRGIPFCLNNLPPIDLRYVTAINLFIEADGDFKNITEKQAKKLKTYLPKNYEEQYLKKEWYIGLTGVPRDVRVYVKKLMNNGIDIDNLTTSKIRLSTIHKAKGSEADNVIFINQYSQAVENELLFNPDGEYRVVFVAITRVIKNLYILENQINKRYDF